MAMNFSCLLAATLLSLTLTATAANAQALEVAPITVELAAGKLTGTIRITNRGAQPTTVQIRPLAWSQRNGEDQLEPTAYLLVSPPFATIASQVTQTIRLVLRQPPAAREGTYRLLIDQLPPEAAPGSIRVALRISLPVFAEPAAAVRSILVWRLVETSPGKQTLFVRNDGTRRSRISDLKLTATGLDAIPTDFTFRYVLAGSEISIPVMVRSGAAISRSTIHITASSDQGKVEADAPVSRLP